ncbi:DUF1671-domain-containing protein [Lophium mytilinum]|uniref:DUF1671-domain-containing protein n=1 Tax=Lophium mytilinum TaxID=390894 RepID=A0A6A6QE65_9PEZI|nr:DUF1671-domain-containing protein [Lophium mytilinum]
MASASKSVSLLTCPMCQYSVLPSDSYVLELHFEQEHTPDSPFRIQEGDDEDVTGERSLPPLPPRPPPKPSRSPLHEPSMAEGSTNDNDTSSDDDDDDNTVLCPESSCGETVLLAELNEHLDLHQAERLTLDADADDHHHSQHPHSQSHSHSPSTTSSSTMQTLTEEPAPSFLEQNFNTAAVPDALRHSGGKAAAGGGQQKPKGAKIKRKRGNSSASEKSTLSRSILSFNPFSLKNLTKERRGPPGGVRLGKAELGPFAWEEKMPKWLHRQLEQGPRISLVNRIGRDGRLVRQEEVQNETPGLIPILAQLSAVDRTVQAAYYCHPAILHIGKTPNEGGFCGYRNIQMLVSYIQGARAQGYDEFTGRTPGILKLQDLIELAWDKGINDIGRAQTGGIRDTRKYIGTPEAQALLLSSQIDCAVDVFSDSPDGRLMAHEQLFNAVEKYFQQAAIPDDRSNVFKTLLPPIYLQQPGHSLTIVGFERRKDGSCNLIIFDPMFHTSPSMHRLKGRRNIRTPRPEVLHAYRRGARQLKKHAAFEILMLTAHPPLFPAWDV